MLQLTSCVLNTFKYVCINFNVTTEIMIKNMTNRFPTSVE